MSPQHQSTSLLPPFTCRTLPPLSPTPPLLLPTLPLLLPTLPLLSPNQLSLSSLLLPQLLSLMSTQTKPCQP